ncbi:unnamed protein product [Nippostrongylus brasiliensis]|uniref:Reverse transcriptase domain-containing protein n=1 Tax=Nippostrongylus brasiliensis TaxID=27835 RepID=A0A0N4Y072_NIPBR|nr:unnamed protein product [Nippostrongylus brasiliensis]
MPEAWRDSTIVPILKQKGDAMECSNYKGINLISHIAKVFERMVNSRFRKMVPISQEQFGFMTGRSISDAIFIVRQVMDKYREKRKLPFLDLLGNPGPGGGVRQATSRSTLKIFAGTRGARVLVPYNKGYVCRIQSNSTQIRCWCAPKISTEPAPLHPDA